MPINLLHIDAVQRTSISNFYSFEGYIKSIYIVD